MSVADGAGLDAVSATILNPTVLESAVERLAHELAAGQPNDTSRMEHELVAPDTELERLTTPWLEAGRCHPSWRPLPSVKGGVVRFGVNWRRLAPGRHGMSTARRSSMNCGCV